MRGGEAPVGRPVLTDLVLGTFRLNGLFLEAAETLARPAGLTAAWWQVLGAVLDEPRPVAGIARDMGLARQSVQRVADLLVDRGLAEYRPNPAHARSRLVAPTGDGLEAIAALRGATLDWADTITGVMGEEELRTLLHLLTRLTEVVDANPVP